MDKILLDGEAVRNIIFVFLWLEFLWALYLWYRQYSFCMWIGDLPFNVKNIMSEGQLEKARLYTLDKLRYLIIKRTFSVLASTAFVSTGMLEKIWTYSESISHWQEEIIISCIWIFILNTIWTLLYLPFILYFIFVLEEKYDFNKQTVGSFTYGMLQDFILDQIICLLITSTFVAVVSYGGDWFFVWLWITFAITSALWEVLAPSYIESFFVTFIPLPQGELRTEIEKLTSEVNFPLDQIYVRKNSQRGNAYLSGMLGENRIVFTEPLLARPENGGCEIDEILGILCHELGHWKHCHVLKHIMLDQIDYLFKIICFSIMFSFSSIYEVVGFPSDLQPVIVGLIVIGQYIMVPYYVVQMVLYNSISRYFEFQADAFAGALGKGKSLQKALIKLYRDNLTLPICDSWFSMWFHSHPSLYLRIQALETNYN